MHISVYVYTYLYYLTHKLELELELAFYLELELHLEAQEPGEETRPSEPKKKVENGRRRGKFKFFRG